MARAKAGAALKRYGMLEGRGTLLVAVALSGGADSMALLHLLRELEPRYGYRVAAIHVNHGLRGAESDRDEAFVGAVCAKWGVPLAVRRADVAGEAGRGESLETAARRVRYALLEEAAAVCCREAGCEDYRIATAHTASDQAETVLFRLIRGSGLKGAGGIPPVRGRVIRPLLDCTREEIEAYCRENAIPFVTDSSNLTDDYARNLLRHRVLPVCRQIGGGAEEALSRFADTAREEDAFLDQLARQALEDALYTPAGWDPAAAFGLTQWRGAELLRLSPVLRRRALRLICGRMDFVPEVLHVDELEALLQKGAGRLTLPGGRLAELVSGRLRLLYAAVVPAWSLEVEWQAGVQSMSFPGGELRISYINEGEWAEKRKINNLLFKNLLDYDKIIGKILLRSRRTGDKLSSAERGVTKPLRRWFSESAVPLPLRNALPVLADDAGPLWTPGLGADRRAAAGEDARHALEIAWEPAAGFLGA